MYVCMCVCVCVFWFKMATRIDVFISLCIFSAVLDRSSDVDAVVNARVNRNSSGIVTQIKDATIEARNTGKFRCHIIEKFVSNLMVLLPCIYWNLFAGCILNRNLSIIASIFNFNLFYSSTFCISSPNISKIAKLDQDLDLYLVYLEI